MARRNSRTWIILGSGTLLTVVLAYAFWPRSVTVDMGEAARSPMTVTIGEEAKTRVHEAYVVSAPVAGRLLRIAVEPGDIVKGGETIVARMRPLNPSALDIRTREQAKTAVDAAGAALRVARAGARKAEADKDLADVELRRTRSLRENGHVSQAALDRSERAAHAANAALDVAIATVSMREADLANAKARLITFKENPAAAGNARTASDDIPLAAPVSGRILRVIQKSETTLAAGTPVIEIGNVSDDLEVVAELLSTDAVQVSRGDRVIIDKWGGPNPLDGVVERVEPWGFTKFSALGVEEQRVNVIIEFTGPRERRQSLGDGFRVETQIVVWESEDTLTVPTSALFRSGGKWHVFVVDGSRARLTPVDVGRNNGIKAQILGGIEAGDRLVLYPGAGLEDGTKVVQRDIE